MVPPVKKPRHDLLAYFSKKVPETEIEVPILPQASSSVSSCVAFTAASDSHEIPTDSEQNDKEQSSSSQAVSNKYDIGLYIGQHTSATDKYNALLHTWQPDFNYLETHKLYTSRKSGSGFDKRHLRMKHFHEHPCLAYSDIKQGLFCKYCVLFPATTGTAGGQDLGYFVKTAVVNFADLKSGTGGQSITRHEKLEYHRFAAQRAASFKTQYDHELDIELQLQKEGEKKQSKLKTVLRSYMRAILTLARTGSSFRGHRDDGNPLEEPVDHNDGLYRELIRAFVDVGDDNLKSHLSTCAQNAMYHSKTIQNELIVCAGKVITEMLAAEINGAKCFTVIADETTDSGHDGQLSVSVRYVNKNVICEKFVTFAETDDLTGDGLATQILDELNKAGITLSGLVGMGFDGASSMSGQFNGAQAHIRRRFPSAIYVHCSSHALNLVITTASKVKLVRDCWTTVQAIVNFIHPFPKRKNCLEETIKQMKLEDPEFAEMTSDTIATRVRTFSETRWIDRHDGVTIFKKFLLPIVEALNKIKGTPTGRAAQSLLDNITFKFLVALCVLERILRETANVAGALQRTAIDLIEATQHIKRITDDFSELRNPSTVSMHFQPIFEEAEEMARKLNVPIEMPRIVGRQIHRENVQAKTPEEYYRLVLFIPFLDSVIQQLTDRFSSHGKIASGMVALLPKFFSKHNFDQLKESIDNFRPFLTSDFGEIETEYNQWRRFWDDKLELIPNNVTVTLSHCDIDFFPNIHQLLKIFATLPVTSATGERSFSTLNFLKDERRSTMREDRLNGLTLMYIHRQLTAKCTQENGFIDKVIHMFLRQKQRRLLGM